MTVIWSQDENGKPVPAETIKKEMKAIKKAYNQACKAHPTFSIFGGSLEVGKHQYQVA